MIRELSRHIDGVNARNTVLYRITFSNRKTHSSVSVGSVPADINLVGPMSAYVMAKAIANAARSAKSVDGYKAFCDVNKK